MINKDLKKAFLIFGGGLLVFLVFRKIKPYGYAKEKNVSGSTGKKSVNLADQSKNAAIVIKAYSDAKRAGESASFLDEMNAEFAKQYGIRVYLDKTTNKLIATDLSGAKI